MAVVDLLLLFDSKAVALVMSLHSKARGMLLLLHSGVIAAF